ncbi:MAG TPA: glycoside hydrolase family 15 protein [Polyangiaceae bacterium]|jgi:GH15 family glucan-1,4-alpha-glucosidase
MADDPSTRWPATTIPYAPIRRHAVIGDRRTAALVAADGTIDWMCVPDYDDEPVFGALLDAERGGWFRFAPSARVWGRQSYLEDTAVAETRFPVGGGEVVAHDAMTLPDDTRDSPCADHRVVVRRLRSSVAVRCVLDLRPRPHAVRARVFCSHAALDGPGPVEFDLRPEEDAWAVLAFGDNSSWTAQRARAALDDTVRRWQRWTSRLRYEGSRSRLVRRSLLVVRLLGYAPRGSLVAAPTTSLPERIGGGWNADYRFAWVRDGSLSLEALARHGDPRAAERYFDWLAGLGSTTGAPLQVVSGIDGRTELAQRELREAPGYRESSPVRMGNHAYEQKQLGMFGFLADCALAYRRHGGTWKDEYFELVARAADYTAQHWDEPDNGIWELPDRRDRVSSRVMSWVTLARASEIAEEIGRGARARPWREAMPRVREQVLSRGYSQRLGAFRHVLDQDSVDAAALLIPIFGFLPGDDPRVVSTVDRVARDLTIDGWVHRFVPSEAGVEPPLPMGEFEGSFVLCTCWLAAAYAIGGRVDRAEAALQKIDAAIGELALMPEGIDARSGEFLGNYPLLFSHAEYVRAVVALDRARRSVVHSGVRSK